MGEPGAGGFDGNDYRKRVLAAVERRGGPAASDPFELYDLPPVDGLTEQQVATRIEEVWAFWQRQRDHPKYRVLVGQLVAGHAERSAELLDPVRRRTAAARVRAQREQRDAERFALLDAAISRLVDRYRAVPRDKVDGLHEVGALAGLTRDEVSARLRRHRMTGPATGADPAAIGPDRRRQLRALLDEFGRLTSVPPPPTLLALLELPPNAGPEPIAARSAAWRSRARELPPGRLRAVLDELLVHVAELLEPGPAAVEAYLVAVAADVAEYLRPRVRAAVLVEDRLVAEDHQQLAEEAVQRGLDPRRAAAVLAAVAAELGAEVEADQPAEAPAAPAPRPEPPPQPRWPERLRAARAELRAGRPGAASRLVAEAEAMAGDAGRTQVRALADEVAAELARAGRRWQGALDACAAGRHGQALPELEWLQRCASDLPGAEQLPELLAQARAAVERAAAAVPPPSEVSAVRLPVGSVQVSWRGPAGVEYRVRCLQADGRWRVVGRTRATTIEDGGAVRGPVGVYAVSAAGPAGDRSAEIRSDG